MGRRLRTHVHVHDADGRTHVFGPDDDVPDWAAERIGNPKAWADDAPADGPEPDADDTDENSEPPRSGPGSGEASWAAYAAARGIEVPDGASRKDIIAAVDAANAEQ
ncbi:hypothetical protein [Streptodolium elevatio]|uniref:Lsr2 protein n=1 Tax=Streptodolium elevatio TaxID=3157996 RepID=A0ABV3DN24_9ACTN